MKDVYTQKEIDKVIKNLIELWTKRARGEEVNAFCPLCMWNAKLDSNSHYYIRSCEYCPVVHLFGITCGSIGEARGIGFMKDSDALMFAEMIDGYKLGRDDQLPDLWDGEEDPAEEQNIIWDN